MAEYVLEGTIKKIEHDATGMALQFVPDAGFVSRRKDADSELTFVALQPKANTDEGLLLAYKGSIKITVKDPKPVYRVGKVRFEFESLYGSNVAKLDKCKVEFDSGNAERDFLIIRVIES